MTEEQPPETAPAETPAAEEPEGNSTSIFALVVILAAIIVFLYYLYTNGYFAKILGYIGI